MQHKVESKSAIVDLERAVKFCTTYCYVAKLEYKEECRRCPLLRKFPKIPEYVDESFRKKMFK